MRLLGFDSRPFHRFAYGNTDRRGRRVVAQLGFHRATVDALPEDLDGLVVAADLQGRELDAREDPPRLVGEPIAETLAKLAQRGALPRAIRVGVILCGDLWAAPALDRRGGSGDVRPVWRAFGERFRWVAGVAGNHDAFEDRERGAERISEYVAPDGDARYIDRTVARLDGLPIGGFSGIVGSPERLFRRTEADFVEWTELLIQSGATVLALHDGPDVPDRRLRGQPAVRDVLERSRPVLVLRGHEHWDEPVATLANGTQVLNVHEKVAVLVREGS